MKNSLLLIVCLLIISCSSLDTIGVNGRISNDQISEVFVSDTNYLLFSNSTHDTNFSFEDFPSQPKVFQKGDSMDIHIWESGPSTLFGSQLRNRENSNSSIQSFQTTLPRQSLNGEGEIFIPYVGRINVLGLSENELERLIYSSLEQKANNPQVFVDGYFFSSSVNILGDVILPKKYELKGSESITDIISVSGGLKFPYEDYVVSVTRKKNTQSLPLIKIYENFENNIRLKNYDIVSFNYQPNKAILLGATNSNKEVFFGPNSSSLLNIIGKAFGINDMRGNLKRVYIFRKTPDNTNYNSVKSELPRMNKNIFDDPNNYSNADISRKEFSLISIDLSSKDSLLYAQTFNVLDEDIIVISNNSIYESQKVLSIIGSIFSPMTGVLNAKNLSE